MSATVFKPGDKVVLVPGAISALRLDCNEGAILTVAQSLPFIGLTIFTSINSIAIGTKNGNGRGARHVWKLLGTHKYFSLMNLLMVPVPLRLKIPEANGARVFLGHGLHWQSEPKSKPSRYFQSIHTPRCQQASAGFFCDFLCVLDEDFLDVVGNNFYFAIAVIHAAGKQNNFIFLKCRRISFQ